MGGKSAPGARYSLAQCYMRAYRIHAHNITHSRMAVGIPNYSDRLHTFPCAEGLAVQNSMAPSAHETTLAL